MDPERPREPSGRSPSGSAVLRLESALEERLIAASRQTPPRAFRLGTRGGPGWERPAAAPAVPESLSGKMGRGPVGPVVPWLRAKAGVLLRGALRRARARLPAVAALADRVRRRITR